VTLSFFEISPWPRIFTGIPVRVARPWTLSVCGVTESPSPKRASRSRRLTGWVLVRNGSNGIDFFMCGPRSLRIRMWIGIWPPSAFGRDFLPLRAPAPLWPRPAVLPTPEPSPRPTRLRLRREPGAGLSECRPIGSSGIVDLHQVADGPDGPADGGVVWLLGAGADLPEPDPILAGARPADRAYCGSPAGRRRDRP
jgi:hypothetical protein